MPTSSSPRWTTWTWTGCGRGSCDGRALERLRGRLKTPRARLAGGTGGGLRRPLRARRGRGGGGGGRGGGGGGGGGGGRRPPPLPEGRAGGGGAPGPRPLAG